MRFVNALLNRIVDCLRRPLRPKMRAENGLTAIEYGVIATLIIAVVVAGMNVFAQKLLELFSSI